MDSLILDILIFYGYEFVSAFIPFLIVFILFRHFHKKKRQFLSKFYYAIIIIFALYIVGVYHFTSAGTLYDGLTYQLILRQDQLNIIPFSNDVDIIEYLLNVLLFIPLGILVPVIWRKMNKLFHLMGIGFVFSFFIEISQLLNNRCTDIDDLIVNTLGAIIGFVLYKIWTKCMKINDSENTVFDIEIPIYILIIFAGRFFLFNEMWLAKVLYNF